MCQEAMINGTVLDSIGELRAVMPGGIVFSPGYCTDGIADDECLCGVDFVATARANGMTVQEPDWQNRWAWEFAPARAALVTSADQAGGRINWRDDPNAIVEDDEPQIGRDYA